MSVENSLGGKEKLCTNKAEQGHPFTTSHDLDSVHPFLRKLGSITLNGDFERQIPQLQIFPFFPAISYTVRYPFGQGGLAGPAVTPPKFLCTPSLHAVEALLSRS